MKRLFKPAAGMFLFCLAMFTAAIYMSCNKNPDSNTSVIKKCVTCLNGGSCIKDTCRCPSGYEGFSCEKMARDKFMGTWNVTDPSSPPSYYSSYITTSGTGSSNDIMISYLHGTYIYATANVKNDTFFIPQQTTSGKTVVGFGVMRYNLTTSPFTGVMAIYYRMIDNTSGDTLDFGYSSPTDSPSVWRRN